MSKRTFRDSVVGPECTIREAMSAIGRSGHGIALVVDGLQSLRGTITDGDVRRAILHGVSLQDNVKRIFEHKPAEYREPVVAKVGTEAPELQELMLERGVRHIPVVDAEGRIQEVVLFEQLFEPHTPDVSAVVMAGGFGKRLRPLTEQLPKVMLPIGGRPLLEVIVGQLRDAGVSNVNITTHYKADIISDHFGTGSDFGISISYLHEGEPLGTAGGLRLLEPPSGPLLVMNGDILAELDIKNFINYHIEQGSDLTVAVRQFDIEVPFGVVACNGSLVRKIDEKPVFNLLVNAGIYLVEPSVLPLIPDNQRFDMTQLIERLISVRRPVASFPIVERWIDIGNHADYDRARQLAGP